MSTFEFIGIKDCGATSCQHCGSERRYIYEWIENGEKRKNKSKGKANTNLDTDI